MIDFFNYLSESNVHGMKVAIGEFTKKELERYLKSGKRKVSDVNKINRKSWAEKFINQQQLEHKATISYRPTRKVSEKEQVFHIAQFIDLSIPKHYNQLCQYQGAKNLEHQSIQYFYKDNRTHAIEKKQEKPKKRSNTEMVRSKELKIESLINDIVEKRKETSATIKQISLLKHLYKEVLQREWPFQYNEVLHSLTKDEISVIINELYSQKGDI